MSDELDPALRALLDAERNAPLAGAAEAKAQILAKVLAGGAAVGGAATGVAASGAAGTAAGAATWSTKVLLLVALGAGGLGAAAGSFATMAAVSKPELAPTDARSADPENAEPSGSEPDQVGGVVEEEVNEEPDQAEVHLDREPRLDDEAPIPALAATPHQAAPVVAMEPQVAASGEDEPLAPPSTLAAERALIDQALSALRAQRAQDALIALMAHERRFASGALAEERDRLSVEALVQLGRSDQAQRRAELFETRYPGSAHLPRIHALLSE